MEDTVYRQPAAVSSLQDLRLMAHADVTSDNDFWAQERAWERKGQDLTRGKYDLFAEEDVEPQIDAYLERIGFTPHNGASQYRRDRCSTGRRPAEHQR